MKPDPSLRSDDRAILPAALGPTQAHGRLHLTPIGRLLRISPFPARIGISLRDLTCHPFIPLRAGSERSERSGCMGSEILRFAQDDRAGRKLRMTGRSFLLRMSLHNSIICQGKSAGLRKPADLRVYLHGCPSHDIYATGSGVGELYWRATI